MGKNAKTQNKNKRDKEKRARKAARQAQYQKWAEQGQNTKSKRFVQKQKSKKCSTVSHPSGRCGNTGCKQCFGVNFNRFLSKGEPKNMPQWMWKKWQKSSEQRNVD